MNMLRSALLALVCCAMPLSASETARYWLLETDRGEILVELERERAPKTTEAIVSHIRAGHYAGTLFHRVIDGFVIQAGGYDAEYKEREVGEQVVNESGNGLRNEQGTVGLARGEDPHSGGAQFYINLDDNEQLDPRPDRWGYAVFGQVQAGMEVVEEIAAIPTVAKGPFDADVPETRVEIEESQVLDQEQGQDWLQQHGEERE